MHAPKQHALPPEEERRTQIALFRYGLIVALLHRRLERGEITAHLRAIAGQPQLIPFSTRTRIDPDTVWRYLARYRGGGFEALKPRPRADAGQPRRIPPELVEKAIALREEVPTRSAATIIQILARDPAFPSGLTIAPRTLRGIFFRRGTTREKLQGVPSLRARGGQRSVAGRHARRSLPPRCRATREVSADGFVLLHRRPFPVDPLR